MLPRVRFAVRSSVMVGFGALCLWSVAGEGRLDPAGPSGSLIAYDAAGGEGYFALSLRAPALGAATAHDHVILVDTSASQTGAHRDQSLQVLEGFLAALPAEDRVQIIAIDVQVKPLADGFHAAGASETVTALEQLRRRVPLGATNLLPGLRGALESAGQSDRPHSVVYIGDGMSTGRLIALDEARALVADLRERHIPVHSYAIGPQTDLQVLGLLATHTGGVVFIDEVIDDGQLGASEIGRRLAVAADAPVFYADELRLNPAPEQLLPSAVPPLRSDRDTIVLGRGLSGDSVKAVATGAGRSLEWTVAAAPAQPGNTFLSALWTNAANSEGLSISVAGADLLNIARQEYEEQVQNLVALGRHAVSQRQLNQAEQIAQAVRRIDPQNVEAETILTASQKVKVQQAKLARFQGETAPEPAEPATPVGPGTIRESDLTRQFEEEKQVRTERLTRQVRLTVEAARKEASNNPDMSIGELKRLLNTVNSSADIDPVSRDTLRRSVQKALDELTTLREKIFMTRLQDQERRSAAEARRLAIDEIVERDLKLEQLIDKVRSLIAEGYLGNELAFEEAEAVARKAWEIAPYSGVTAAAIFNAEAAGQLDTIERIRYARSDKFLQTMLLVEKAHIPFPDEPPIVWPAPEVWKALTERRKKWASVDLVEYNAAESRIRAALDKPTEVNFLETTLEDAINYLKDYHDIPIVIDKPSLEDEGVSLESPVTLNLSGVSFRSTLKLLLEQMQLTWVIEDEVMKITTITRATERLSTRVYPVADLVIPIATPQAGGLGQGLGGTGGIGGGGGALGGGQFGAGGGGMGGGGMMGGGMMNVADEPAPGLNNDTVRQRKKKLPMSN